MRWSKVKKICQEHNEFVGQLIANLMDYKEDIDHSIVYSNCEIFSHESKIYFDELKEDNFFVTKKEITKFVNESRAKAIKRYDKLIEDFEFIKKKTEDNKEPFSEFVGKFRPGFYTITFLSNNSSKYFYIKDIEENYDYGYSVILYGIISNIKSSTNMWINHKIGCVSKMTRDEFKKHYLLDRIKTCDISNENELDEYIKMLTEKFNKWKQSQV